MRDEAPIYYDEDQDFYALTRHADVAAAFKDHESFSSSRGCIDPGRSEASAETTAHKTIIFMDPPDHRHMRSLLNKAFTPRAIQAQRRRSLPSSREVSEQGRPDGFDVVQEFSGAVPRRGHHPMAGCSRGVPANRFDIGSMKGWIASRARSTSARRPCRPTSTTRCSTYGLVQKRRSAPAGRSDSSSLSGRNTRREDGSFDKLDDLDIAAFASLLGGAGAETVTKLVGNAASCSASIRTNGGTCRRTAAKFRPPSRNSSVTRRRRSTTCAATCAMFTCTAPRSPRAARCF